MSADVARLAEAGIRARHPGISDADLRYGMARRRYGQELADAAFGRSGDASESTGGTSTGSSG